MILIINKSNFNKKIKNLKLLNSSKLIHLMKIMIVLNAILFPKKMKAKYYKTQILLKKIVMTSLIIRMKIQFSNKIRLKKMKLLTKRKLLIINL